MNWSHILTVRAVALCVDELAIDAHLVDLLQTEAVVPEIGLAQAPPMRQNLCRFEPPSSEPRSYTYQALKLPSYLRKSVIDGLEGRRDIFGLVLRAYFLHNVETFLQQGGTYGLRGREGTSWAHELAINAFPADQFAVARYIGNKPRV